MEKRGEPRFPVKSPIRVIVPGDSARTIDSSLIDISATGMRFLTVETLDPENLVAIEVDSRLILAEVRYCQPRGDRFVVGARRLHEIAKDAQLSDAPAVVSEMLGHLHRHITDGGATDSQMTVEALEQIVERSENPGLPDHELAELQAEPLPVEPVLEQPATVESFQPKENEIVEAPEAEPLPVEPVAEQPVPAESSGPKEEEIVVAPEAEPPPAEPVAEQPAPAESPEPRPEEIVAATLEPEPEPLPVEPVAEQPAPVESLEPNEEEIVQALEAEPPTVEPVAEQSAPVESPEPRPEEIVATIPEPEPEPLPSETVAEQPDPKEEEIVAAAPESEPVPLPREPVAKPAAPVELPASLRLPQPATPRAVDPLEAARDALYALNTAANHAEPRISRNSKKWRVVIGVAAGLILAAALAMFFLERRGEAKPAPSLHTANAVEVPPIVVAAPKPAIHHALIHVLHPISVSLAIDNGKPSKSSFEQNDTPQFDFAKSATLRVSDGAAIEIRIDGNTEGPLLSGPQVLHLTPNGVELVK